MRNIFYELFSSHGNHNGGRDTANLKPDIQPTEMIKDKQKRSVGKHHGEYHIRFVREEWGGGPRQDGRR